jgi:hypothetical protein
MTAAAWTADLVPILAGNPGLISGTSTTAGTFGFVVKITDFAGDHVDMNGKITID